MSNAKTLLITGAAVRIGAACARMLHQAGYNIILHYHNSQIAAEQLSAELNALRTDSAVTLKADLLQLTAVQQLAKQAQAIWGAVDGLINNAALFYPQTVAATTEASWDNLFDGNVKAPFFLAQALHSTLAQQQGCVINIIDIHAERGLPGYPAYSISKAGLAAMTRILAKEWAPSVRVNGVSPGAILWPADDTDLERQQAILSHIPLARLGTALDVAKAVRFLIEDANYLTGQIITVDGGRLLYS